MTSADSDFAVRTYEFDFIVDYLVKPIEMERLKMSIDRIQNQIKTEKIASQAHTPKSESFLYVNIDRRLVKIEIGDIEIIKAYGDYIKIITNKNNFTVHVTLKRIEEKLPSDTFFKVHRSFIININKIVDIEDNSVLIQRDVIPISKSNRIELRRRLNLL